MSHTTPHAVRQDTTYLFLIAATIALLHMVTNGRYGFHRDELQFLSDARHLDWGFVAYPPLTPVLERLGLQLFGLSLVGLRLFSVLAQSAAIVLTGLIARELGGERLAQVAAATAVALSPMPMFEGTEFQYTSFDYLWWVAIAFFVSRLLRTDDARNWIGIGLFLGIGLETKYTMLFFLAGLLGGMLLTPARRYFASRWFWVSVGLAVLLVVPNLLWQLRHGFISQQFLAHIHARDVGEGRADGFWWQQVVINANLWATPVWVAGAIAFLRSPRFRMMGWMYVIPLALFAAAKGRAYYVAAAYPMLFAMGAVVAERWLHSLNRMWQVAVRACYFTGVVLWGVLVIAMLVPVATGGALKTFALKSSSDLREEIGWEELVQSLAGIRDGLSVEQQQGLGIVTGNYGEQGAVEILGAAYRLPAPISMTNSAWLRGYPTPQPTTLVVMGFSAKSVDRAFTNCRPVATTGNRLNVRNEEQGQTVFLCGPPRLTWPEFWKKYQSFG